MHQTDCFSYYAQKNVNGFLMLRGNQESSSFKQPDKLYHVFLNFGPQDDNLALSREGKFNVFLSFRGDTRKEFTDYLHTSLVKEKIPTFRDTEELEPGEDIKSAMTKAIRNSRLSVIVFSADYAVSKWCLDELLVILEHRRYSRHRVLPVFYDVSPAEIRKQNGLFQKAFDYYEEKIKADPRNIEWKNKVSAWQNALVEVSHLSGSVLMNECNGYAGKFVEKIVGIVQKKLNRKNVDLRLNYGLSMNVKDTCMPFKYKLHKALNEDGFLVFRDDNDLDDEENIRSQLFTAIEKSWLSIVVFSRNYFYSSCCLEELVKILEWHENSGHIVFPVFYDVEPSEVRHQTRSVGEAFVRYEKKNQEMDGGRRLMAGGMHLQKFPTWEGSPATILMTVTRDRLLLAAMSNNYTVGLHSRAKSIILWLHDKSSAIQILVVCGVVGIGKSAIAKFVYDSNQHFFESRIFLADIRVVVSENSDGLRILQKQILSCLSNGTEEQAYGNWENMTRKVKDAICWKRVFVVLDDVSDEGQIYELLGAETFFPGSKIIVTTTSSQMLSLSANEVYKVYMVSPLNDDESLELFSWYAFGQDHPKQVYIEQSVRAVEQCRGIPESLKFLGSLLFGRIDHNKWEDELKSFGAISETTFVELLKRSYDSLQDERDKVLFLHIACFFVGEDKVFTFEILNKWGFFTSIGIQNLVDRGLLFINRTS